MFDSQEQDAMRLDKFLKVSRLIVRRPVATDLCNAGKVTVNDRVAKAATKVKVGDILEISFPNGPSKVRIEKLANFATKEGAADLYRPVS